MMSTCQICGNEIALGAASCRFCGARQEIGDDARKNTRPFVHRTVNLEEGRPYVEEALKRLAAVLEEAKRQHVQALTIIHGYGSSGRGGRIRTECRKSLDYMCQRGELKEYIVGEHFSRRNGVVKNLLNRYPQLAVNKNLNRNNRGITLVIL